MQLKSVSGVNLFIGAAGSRATARQRVGETHDNLTPHH
jgi:hypothetical protein